MPPASKLSASSFCTFRAIDVLELHDSLENFGETFSYIGACIELQNEITLNSLELVDKFAFRDIDEGKLKELSVAFLEGQEMNLGVPQCAVGTLVTPLEHERALASRDVDVIRRFFGRWCAVVLRRQREVAGRFAQGVRNR